MKSFFAATLATFALGQEQMPHLISNNGPNYTPLNITEDGEAKTIYIASPFWYTGEGGE